MTVVRVAFTQATWTGDKESMIDLHEAWTREAAAQGAQVIGFQELFYGPYFGITQDTKYYDYAETDPRADHGPLRGAGRRAGHRHRAADLRGGPARRPLQHGGRDRRRRHRARQVPQAPHPAPAQVLGEVLLPSRQPRVPRLRDGRRQDRREHLLRPALPRGLAQPGAQRRRDRVQPERHRARACPTACGRSSSRPPPSPTATSSSRTTASGSEDNEYGDEAVNFYGSSYAVGPDGNFVGEIGSSTEDQLIVRDLDLEQIREVRERWQFFRDRRPDAYGPIVAP